MPEEEESAGEYEVPEYEWTKERAIHDLLGFASELQQATAQYFEVTTARMAADSNYGVSREEMHSRVAQEIESLPVFQEPEATDG